MIFNAKYLSTNRQKNRYYRRLERLHKDGTGIKTLRPEDYFAEMAKKDDLMKRVSQSSMIT